MYKKYNAKYVLSILFKCTYIYISSKLVYDLTLQFVTSSVYAFLFLAGALRFSIWLQAFLSLTNRPPQGRKIIFSEEGPLLFLYQKFKKRKEICQNLSTAMRSLFKRKKYRKKKKNYRVISEDNCWLFFLHCYTPFFFLLPLGI